MAMFKQGADICVEHTDAPPILAVLFEAGRQIYPDGGVGGVADVEGVGDVAGASLSAGAGDDGAGDAGSGDGAGCAAGGATGAVLGVVSAVDVAVLGATGA